MNALLVSLMCFLPMAGELLAEPADESKRAETPGDTPPSRLRVWSARTGNQQIEAEFIKLRSGRVYLRKGDGGIAYAPADKLSEPDREWLSKNTTRDGCFRWDPRYQPPWTDAETKNRTPERTLRIDCRPLAATLSTADPIRIVLHWSRVWHLPASGSEPAEYRPSPHPEVSILRYDTLNSLKIHVRTPAGRRYSQSADFENSRVSLPGYRTMLFLTIAEKCLSEREYVRGQWKQGKMAGLDQLGRFSIQIEGTLFPRGKDDAPFQFKTDSLLIERVDDDRKALAEIEAIARAKLARLSGADEPRGLPGAFIPTAVIELENGNREVNYYAGPGKLGWGYYTVELTPQGDPIQVTLGSRRNFPGEEHLRWLFHRSSDGEIIWPKPIDDR